MPLDTKIEKTLRNLKKVREAKEAVMTEHREGNQNISVIATDRPQQRQRTMEDFWRPVIREEYSSMRHRSIEANNFELKPALITMVQKNQFTGHPSEYPNEHLSRFLRMVNTVKLNGVNPDVIKLQLFPFSLRDITTSWFESLPYGLVSNCEEIVEAYLRIFFPPAEIIAFKRKEDESLYNAWERYKQLLRRYLMHGI